MSVKMPNPADEWRPLFPSSNVTPGNLCGDDIIWCIWYYFPDAHRCYQQKINVDYAVPQLSSPCRMTPHTRQ